MCLDPSTPLLSVPDDQRTLLDLFVRVARRMPDAVAIDGPAAPETYGALRARAAGVASALRELPLPLPAPAIVGILARNPADVIAGVLGALEAGHAFMACDPSVPEARLRSLCATASPSAWLVDEATEPLARAAASDVPRLSVTVNASTSSADDPAQPAAHAPHAHKDPDEIAYIYFTSGSTGTPKPIAGTLRAATHFIRWECGLLDAGPGTRITQFTLPSFDGFLKDVFVALCSGGTVCVPDDRALLLDPDRLIRWLEDRRVTVLHCVPSLFRLLLTALTPGRLPHLAHVALAGEQVLPSDVKRWMEVMGTRVRLYNFYGPTETTVIKACHVIEPADAEARAVPIGRPLPGADLLVLDGGGHDCPHGIVGEIYIRTAFRAMGYYGRPDLTAELFVPHPGTGDQADILYRTGDLGRRRADDEVEFVGRRDHQVKIRGVRVELGEIEDVLRRHPSVRDTVVVARTDDAGQKDLCAYVVLAEEARVADVHEHLARWLPDSTRPAWIVRLDELPRTSNGKVHRAALPAPQDATVSEGPREPRTLVERELVTIWEAVLGRAQPGIHDNFFHIGGHSLRVTQVVSRIRARFGVEVSLAQFFEGPTIAALAGHIETAILAGATEDQVTALLAEAETPAT